MDYTNLDAAATKGLVADPAFDGIKREGRRYEDKIWFFVYLITFATMCYVTIFALNNADMDAFVPNTAQKKALTWFENLIAIMKSDYDVIFGGFVSATILGGIWIHFLRHFTKLLIYVTLIFSVISVFAVSAYFFLYNDYESIAMKWSGVITGVIGILMTFTLFALRKKIDLTTKLFIEACKGVAANRALYFIAIIELFVVGGFALGWVTSVVHLYAVPDSVAPAFENSMYFMIFGGFWSIALLTALFQTTVAGTIANWYFSRSVYGSHETGIAAFKSFGRASTTSIGTLCLGSLLVAITSFINFMLERTRRANRRNKVAYYILSCLTCAFRCLQSIIEFISRYSYVYVAMYGDNFCDSAKSVFNLMKRNPITIVFLDTITGTVLTVGKIGGTALTHFIAMKTLDSMDRMVSGVTMSVIAILAYTIFSIYSSVIGMAANTVFVCYMEDLERNSESKEYFMSPDTHNALQKALSKKQLAGDLSNV